MMPSESIKTNEPRSGGIGPGDRLQAARIESGLSIEDIANRMHLSVSILESIEENNFEEITAPIFVKGYLRAYARIVSLGEEDMIQQYIEFYSDEDPPINTTSNTSPEISADDARVKWTTYIVILVLCGLLAAWWWNMSQERGDSVSLDVEQSNFANAEPADDSPEAEQAQVVAVSEESAEVSEPVITAEVDTVAESVPQPTEVSHGSVESEVDREEQFQSVSEVQNLAEDPTTTESEPATVKTELSTAEIIASVNRTSPFGNDTLNLVVHADTWVDIKDFGGNRLAYDLLRADSTLTLTGEAPFSVFFGNGHGVEMTFNGEEVDVSSRVRNDNTARLKIGND